MIRDISALDFNKLYTYADYLTWQVQERIELIKGRIFKMSPAPLRYHQELSSALHRKFSSYLKRKPGKVFHAPFDVGLPKAEASLSDEQIYIVVQPDITVVCDPSKLDRRGCIGAREYWIAIPSEAILEVFKLDKQGKYHF